jgi:hypothetical protein
MAPALQKREKLNLVIPQGLEWEKKYSLIGYPFINIMEV